MSARVAGALLAALVTLAPSVATAEPASAGRPRIVALGDSLTEGYGLASEQAWPDLLQKTLKLADYEVNVAQDGPTALQYLRAASIPVDLVIADLKMPGMDGLQASRHIKSDETLQHPPHIVLVTAFGREEVREEAERLQLDGFLVKPVTKSMIVDTL